MPELKSFDRVADIYDETRALPAEPEARIAGAIAGLLRSAGAERTRLLEIGAGTGRVAAPLAGRGVRVTGADIAPKMLAKLREKRDDIAVVLAEAAHPPFADASFHGVLFVHILHLVPDVETTVRAALRVVCPGGVIIHGADDPNRGSIRDRAEILVRESVAAITGDALPAWRPYFDSEAVLERVLTAAGASIERRCIAEWTGRTSGQKMLRRLERRDFASSWLIPDAALPAIIQSVGPQLEALFGGMDAEHEYPRSFSIVAGRLPG